MNGKLHTMRSDESESSDIRTGSRATFERSVEPFSSFPPPSSERVLTVFFTIMPERKPYDGTERKLVIAMDLGTTFSGVSYR